MPVWAAARESLLLASVWIVCGYSLPEYDTEVRELLSGAADALRTLVLMGPSSGQHAEHWSSLLPRARVIPIPGLPEGIGGITEFDKTVTLT